MQSFTFHLLPYFKENVNTFHPAFHNTSAYIFQLIWPQAIFKDGDTFI